MSKKQFEHIENKFREAAANYQPPLNEEAWLKMERLLDQPAPKRRGGGFWLTSLVLLLLLSAGIGGYYYYQQGTAKRNQGNENSPVATQSHSVEKTKLQPALPPSTIVTRKRPQQQEPERSAAATLDDINEKKDGRLTGVAKPQITTMKKYIVKPLAARKDSRPKEDGLAEIKMNLADDDRAKAAKPVEQDKRSLAYQPSKDKTVQKPEDALVKSKPATDKQPAIATPVQDKPANAADNNQQDITKANMGVSTPKVSKPATNETAVVSHMAAKEMEKQQRVNNVLSRFCFTASIASDGNAVKGAEIKRITAMYGAGIGFNINKRFSIQTGVYAGSKKYSADSSAYYRKPGYWRMVRIRKIDADCFVYNVPLSLRYNITASRQGNLYATGGVSSYFMQKEKYDYYYSYRNSDSVRHVKEVFGENTHLFSVLDFSIGYEHKFSKHFSLQAEPYLKLPLRGIGEGKVELYSAGLMLGFKFRP